MASSALKADADIKVDALEFSFPELPSYLQCIDIEIYRDIPMTHMNLYIYICYNHIYML